MDDIRSLLAVRPRDVIYVLLKEFKIEDLLNLCHNIRYDNELQLIFEYWGVANQLCTRERPWPWYRILAHSTVPLARVFHTTLYFVKDGCIIEMADRHLQYEAPVPYDFPHDIYDVRIVIMKLMGTKYPFPRVLLNNIDMENTRHYVMPFEIRKTVLRFDGVGFTTKQLFDIHSRLFAMGYRFTSSQVESEEVLGKQYK
jgi:hypothetical protein